MYILKNIYFVYVSHELQLTLKLHEFELQGSTSEQIFSIDTWKNFLEIFNNLKKLPDEVCGLEIPKTLRES